MGNTEHRHVMKRSVPHSGKVYKCTSCLFRCTGEVLAQVEASASRHRAVKRGSPQAKTIWTGPKTSVSETGSE